MKFRVHFRHNSVHFRLQNALKSILKFYKSRFSKRLKQASRHGSMQPFEFPIFSSKKMMIFHSTKGIFHVFRQFGELK